MRVLLTLARTILRTDPNCGICEGWGYVIANGKRFECPC